MFWLFIAWALAPDAHAQRRTAPARCAPDELLREASRVALDAPSPTTGSLRTMLEQRGLPAPSVRLWIARGADAALEEAMSAWLDTQPLDPRACRVGRTCEDGRCALVVVPRVASLTLRHDTAQGTSVLHASAAFPLSVSAPHVVALSPSGRTTTAPLDAPLDLREPGLWIVQLVASTTAGPQPWAQRAVHIRRDGVVEEGVVEPIARVDHDIASSVRDERTWILALNRLRERQGLEPLRVSPLLAPTARSRIASRARFRSVAHALGPGDEPDAHLSRERVTARRVAENIVRAPSLVEAFERLEQSPSHRATRRDDFVDSIAVSALRADDGWYVLELFAASPAISP
jgi:hypothetical protein